jgi:hypothetical protein
MGEEDYLRRINWYCVITGVLVVQGCSNMNIITDGVSFFSLSVLKWWPLMVHMSLFSERIRWPLESPQGRMIRLLYSTWQQALRLGSVW